MAGKARVVNTIQTVCSNEGKGDQEETKVAAVGSEMYACDDVAAENYFFESDHHLLRSNQE